MEGQRRLLNLPQTFDVPEHDLWTRGYRAEASRATGLSALELEDALTVVRPFLDPLLDGSASGDWNRRRRAWVWLT